jgi:hypothetical protein
MEDFRISIVVDNYVPSNLIIIGNKSDNVDLNLANSIIERVQCDIEKIKYGLDSVEYVISVFQLYEV